MLVLPQNVIESLAEFVMVIMLVMELVVSMISLCYFYGLSVRLEGCIQNAEAFQHHTVNWINLSFRLKNI